MTGVDHSYIYSCTSKISLDSHLSREYSRGNMGNCRYNWIQAGQDEVVLCHRDK